jgi:hypothetical protein
MGTRPFSPVPGINTGSTPHASVRTSNGLRVMQAITFLAILVFAASIMGCTRISVAYDFFRVAKTANACFENIKVNPKYSLLYEKLAIAGQMPTDAQLSDEERPSPDVIQLGMDWFEEDQVCNQTALEIYSNMDSDFGARVAGWLAETTDIFNDTMAKTPTFGYINGRIQHLRERQRQDTRDWIVAETKRRQLQMQRETANGSFVSDTALAVLLGAVQILVARQQVIAHTQIAYLARVPTYRPIHIPKTACSLRQKVICSGGYTTRDYLGNLVDSRTSFTAKDYFGNLVNSRSHYTTRDSLGNLVDSQSDFQTRDAYGNLVRSQQ